MTEFDAVAADGTATVIRARGRLDLLAAPRLKALVQSTVNGAGTPVVVVDLAGVPFIDSTGLGALVSGLRTTRQAGGDLRIAGAGAQVLSVLTMTRIDRVLHPYPSVEDAVRGS